VLDLSSAGAARTQRAAGLVAIYRAAKTLIRHELEDADDVDACHAALNEAYDAFVGCYGVISDPANTRLFRDVPELAFLLALEQGARKTAIGWTAERERIFSERTLRPIRVAKPGSLSPHEALLRCLDEIGTLDMPRVARLSGRTLSEVVEQFGDLLFRLPGSTMYDVADAYLSGNVRAKLREARLWLSVIRPVRAMWRRSRRSSPRRLLPATSFST
jgi:N12 class adenine-specific DNA methylase